MVYYLRWLASQPDARRRHASARRRRIEEGLLVASGASESWESSQVAGGVVEQ